MRKSDLSEKPLHLTICDTLIRQSKLFEKAKGVGILGSFKLFKFIMSAHLNTINEKGDDVINYVLIIF